MAARRRVTAATDAARFTKENIVTMKRYANRRDLLTALLDEKQTYSLDEVDAKIETFLKGKVK